MRGGRGPVQLECKTRISSKFFFTGLGLILLPLAQDVPQACGAVAIRGIGSGLFGSPFTPMSLWKQAIMNATSIRRFCPLATRSFIGSSAFATFLIWISHRLGVGDLRSCSWQCHRSFCWGSGPCQAKRLPSGTDWRARSRAFFANRRNQAAQIYLMGGAATHILQQAVIPLAAFTVLGSALNVGGFNTIFAIAGALALLAVGARRRPENRLRGPFGMSSIVLVALDVMLGFSMTLVTLIAYTIRAPASTAYHARLPARYRPEAAEYGRDKQSRKRFLPRHDPARCCLMGVANACGAYPSRVRQRRPNGARGYFPWPVFHRRRHHHNLCRRADTSHVAAMRLSSCAAIVQPQPKQRFAS